MNYEAKVSDLSSASTVLIEDGESDEGGNRRRNLIIAAIVAAVILVVVAYKFLGGEEQAAFAPDEGGTAPAVTVVAPGRATIAGVINATGSLAARREMPVGVVGEGGRVVAVNFEAGDWVRPGEVMVVIDRSVQSQQAQSSAAQIEVARADANLAQANLDRALKLVDRGFISQADIDRLTATRDAARARVRVSEAQYRELLARNARLNIVAPAGGLVLERSVEVGQVVGAGTALLSIARGGEIELLVQLGETDLAAVPVGATATVTPAGADKSFTCQVWQKAPVISAQTRQGTARCVMPYAPELRPGGFATAQLNSGTIVAPMLPESAIQSDDKGSYVYIIDGQNKVVRRPIVLGMVSDDGIAIASGLDGSERVVVRAAGFLSVGDTVRPILRRN